MRTHLPVTVFLHSLHEDAFAKIDGGGEGRDANDDRKMTPEEWMEGYKKVKGYDFVCLDGVENDEQAKEMFGKIDENGGGIVLLIEFCDYIKATEIAAGTQKGKLLNAEETPEEIAARAARKAAKVAAGGGDDPLSPDVTVEDRGRYLWDLYRPSYIR